MTRRDPALIARLCERVYRDGLHRNGETMIAKDGDDGTKLRRRAKAYEPLVRAVLHALDEEQPAPAPREDSRLPDLLRAGWLAGAAA